MGFDFRRPRLLSYDRAVARIGDAWLAQYRGWGWSSSVIARATGGPHSHSALLRRNACEIDVLELREWHGGRIRPLRDHVERWPGRIDVFRPNAGGRWSWDVDRPLWHWDAGGVVAYMEMLTRMEYGYRAVLRVALRRLPLAWRFYPITTQDVVVEDSRKIRPFCSHAVSLAYREGGGVDVVPRCPDYLVTPNDLTRSLFFEYEFTLVP